MENNIMLVESPTLCAFHENDFSELWSNGDIRGSGAGTLDSGSTDVDGDQVEVEFSPREG